jgi:GTP-binding protein HflX
VRTVLAEIGADRVPELLVFNKIDRLPGEAKGDVERLLAGHEGSIAISARTGEGVDPLLLTVADRLRSQEQVIELLVPWDRGDVVARLHREGEVLSEAAEDGALRVRARLDAATAGRYREWSPPVVPREAGS